ncbi:collagen-like protein [Leeuwenhoekiella aequorea]|uniref:collagen-like protein n=1 Tax=Leeuwenhoekiella aequorea TaxID=283736 RepID=UPI00352C6892|tara:strand:+ start:154 stop:699 length:546 start_codon:yes stop_codon:yes gene_type:complete
MKKITIILSLFTLVLASCSGSDGRDGIDGLDGINTLSAVFEVTGIDYVYDSANNEWFTQNPIPFDGIEVLEGDAVLVYLADGTVTASDGQPTDLWKLMPITFFDASGEFQYEFNYTFDSVELNIVGNFDLSALNDAAVSNQKVRIVVIPAEYAQDFNGNFSNYNEVMSTLELKESDIQILD